MMRSVLLWCGLLAAFGLALAFSGCPLHDPIPCQGEPYPAPCLARDAGAG